MVKPHRPADGHDVLDGGGGLIVTHSQAHSVAGVDGVLDAQVSGQARLPRLGVIVERASGICVAASHY